MRRTKNKHLKKKPHSLLELSLPISTPLAQLALFVFMVTTLGGSKGGEYLCLELLLLIYVDRHRARAPPNPSESAQCLQRQ